MTTLSGTEILYPLGVQSNSQPSSVTETCSTQDIANLSVAKRGTFTLNGATPVTVAFTGLTATQVITYSLKTVGGTVGVYPAIQTVTPGTGFTVAGTAGDTSVYTYIVE